MSGESLVTYYKGWDNYQDLLVAAVAPLTPEQLVLRAAPNQREVWTIPAHIIATRVWWFPSIMGEGDAGLEHMQPWDDDGHPRPTAAGREEGMERTVRIMHKLRSRGSSAEP